MLGLHISIKSLMSLDENGRGAGSGRNGASVYMYRIFMSLAFDSLSNLRVSCFLRDCVCLRLTSLVKFDTGQFLWIENKIFKCTFITRVKRL